MSSITCGNCKCTHTSVQQVKRCYGASGRLSDAPLPKPEPDSLPVGTKPHGSEVKPGFYTIVFDEASDDRITLRVKPHWDGTSKRGELVVGYLRGSDNTKDYTNFGFLFKNDPRCWSIWKRFRAHGDTTRLVRALHVLHEDPAAAGEAYAIRSSNCAMCGHTLTVPASVHRGLGPVCAGKEWY